MGRPFRLLDLLELAELLICNKLKQVEEVEEERKTCGRRMQSGRSPNWH